MSDPIDLALRRAHARAAAAFLGLPLDPAHLDGVVANLALLETHARTMMAVVPDGEAVLVSTP